MSGPHDVGGRSGFGPVTPEHDEPVFHAGWERRAMGLVIAAGAMGHWSIDESRRAREDREPADYYGSSYYEIWVKGLERLLLRHGFVTPADLEAGQPIDPTPRPKRVLAAEAVPVMLARGGPCDRPVESLPRFAVGDPVVARASEPAGHTRLPRYAWGKRGVIAAAHGGYVFPDSNAEDAGEDPQHLYTVAFSGAELWGSGADAGLVVSIDAWESYLESA
jgi:nitrile hydratase